MRSPVDYSVNRLTVTNQNWIKSLKIIEIMRSNPFYSKKEKKVIKNYLLLYDSSNIETIRGRIRNHIIDTLKELRSLN